MNVLPDVEFAVDPDRDGRAAARTAPVVLTPELTVALQNVNKQLQRLFAETSRRSCDERAFSNSRGIFPNSGRRP